MHIFLLRMSGQKKKTSNTDSLTNKQLEEKQQSELDILCSIFQDKNYRRSGHRSNCRSRTDQGHCRFGKNCHFSHDGPRGRDKTERSPQEKKMQKTLDTLIKFSNDIDPNDEAKINLLLLTLIGLKSKEEVISYFKKMTRTTCGDSQIQDLYCVKGSNCSHIDCITSECSERHHQCLFCKGIMVRAEGCYRKQPSTRHRNTHCGCGASFHEDSNRFHCNQLMCLILRLIIFGRLPLPVAKRFIKNDKEYVVWWHSTFNEADPISILCEFEKQYTSHEDRVLLKAALCSIARHMRSGSRSGSRGGGRGRRGGRTTK